MTRYAAKTTVPVERSKAEVERLLGKYGCAQFTTGVDRVRLRAQVQFALEERIVRFLIQLPDPADDVYQLYTDGRPIPDGTRAKLLLQDERQRWRALFLSIKARLVSWDEHIETFEEAFMAHIVLPNNKTVGSEVIPAIVAAYETGTMPSDRLLPAYDG